MCGISGIIRFDNKKVEKNYLKKMYSTLKHRGPDCIGYWLKNNIGLAHNRLKIIDINDSSNQPFIYRNLILIFNGKYIITLIKTTKLNYTFKHNQH